MMPPEAWPPPAIVPVQIPIGLEATRAQVLEVVAAFAYRATNTVVTDLVSYNGASDTLREVATLTKALDERRSTEKEDVLAAGRAIDAAYKPTLASLIAARASLETERNTFRLKQERAAREAQEAANAVADRERLRKLALARKAAERGDIAKMEHFEAIASMIVAPIIETPSTKTEGVSTRPVWTFDVTDANAVPREYLIPDTEAIAAVVKALGERAVGRIPGVRVYSREATIVRSVK